MRDEMFQPVLIKQLMKTFKEETQNTPKYSNVLFASNRLRSPKKPSFFVVLFGWAALGKSCHLSESVSLIFMGEVLQNH
uniref:Uncharacterized protein n=2 Tax=Equus TaxID=9789 RepID=A0A3Q2HDI6_HORSE